MSKQALFSRTVRYNLHPDKYRTDNPVEDWRRHLSHQNTVALSDSYSHNQHHLRRARRGDACRTGWIK